MGIVDEELLLKLSDLWGPLGVLVLVLAFPIVLLVALRPRLLWPLLLSSAIIGVGPRIKGYTLLDEAVLSCAVFGAILHLMIKRPKKDHHTIDFERVLFLGWTTYMVVQSIVGTFANQDLRIVRWLVLYTMIGCTVLLVRDTRTFPFPPARQACIVIVASTLLSYVGYVGQGMYYEAELGPHGRFLSQDYVWSGSAYAVFPTLVAVPAAVFLSRDRSKIAKTLIALTLALLVFVAFYFDSRISWFTLFGYGIVIVASRLAQMRYVLAAALAVVLMFAAYMPNPVEDVGGFMGELVQTSEALWKPSKSDVGRNLQLKAGWLTLIQNPRTFLIGTGVYSHRFAVIPVITALFDEFLPEQDFVIAGSRSDSGLGITIFRTTGFTAALVDTGVVGMLLFIAVYATCAYNVFRRGSQHRYLLMMAVLIGFCWLLISNILDIVLLYLLIMPGGVIEKLDVRATSELAWRSEARARSRSSGLMALAGAQR